eukprot:15076-Heterococcus_DN1.PRE.5
MTGRRAGSAGWQVELLVERHICVNLPITKFELTQRCRQRLRKRGVAVITDDQMSQRRRQLQQAIAQCTS